MPKPAARKKKKSEMTEDEISHQAALAAMAHRDRMRAIRIPMVPPDVPVTPEPPGDNPLADPDADEPVSPRMAQGRGRPGAVQRTWD